MPQIDKIELSDVELTTEPVIAFFRIRICEPTGVVRTVMKRYGDLVEFFDAAQIATGAGFDRLPRNVEDTQVANSFFYRNSIQANLDKLLTRPELVRSPLFQEFFHVSEEYQVCGRAPHVAEGRPHNNNNYSLPSTWPQHELAGLPRHDQGPTVPSSGPTTSPSNRDDELRGIGAGLAAPPRRGLDWGDGGGGTVFNTAPATAPLVWEAAPANNSFLLDVPQFGLPGDASDRGGQNVGSYAHAGTASAPVASRAGAPARFGVSARFGTGGDDDVARTVSAPLAGPYGQPPSRPVPRTEERDHFSLPPSAAQERGHFSQPPPTAAPGGGYRATPATAVDQRTAALPPTARPPGSPQQVQGSWTTMPPQAQQSSVRGSYLDASHGSLESTSSDSRAKSTSGGMSRPWCVICMAKPEEVAVDPCGHLSMCQDCATMVKCCPVCRGPIEKLLRVFVVK
eukprot:gnl/TRDRNA2_/TRDRNA2_126444_c0_seq1.p1 gnl/TRDRNA2_/TRDRNA2_126444_c0~~gnl/TRDRNA2_/TRDRNA2_126444_c0_seq1.p1  ORF type:complete len:454 (-),score=44.64 gnl/TRDRNA2_/TRDRNA2_126444_c0_seq1:70-1431(-)